MYIETIPRRLGGLASHLLHTGRGSNERVSVRSDLSRDMPADVELGLRLLAAPARRIRRMKRDVVHVVLAPERQLTRDEVERVLELYEAEYGIPPSNARLVVEHVKGDRASHFHIVYSMASEAEGKALRFTQSADRDEMLARRLEIEFGMKLQPSTRVDRTVELLRERGLADLAQLAAEGPRSEKGKNRTKAERQQERRLGSNRELIDARLMQAWRQCASDLTRLPAELGHLGFELAAGAKRIAGVPIVLLVDTESLYTGSLTHDLNRARKAAGETVRIREPAMGAAVGELKPEKEVKASLRLTAPQRATEAVLNEFDRLAEEMDAAGEREEAAKAKVGRARLAARLSAEECQSLKARQGKVRSRYQQRDRIRRARVNHAFIAARLFGSREVRKIAFLLISVGVLAVGGSLLTALAASGAAVSLIPTFTSAKRRRAEADQAAALDRNAMAKELRAETQRFFRERAIALQLARQQKLAREQQLRAARDIRMRRDRVEQLRRSQEMASRVFAAGAQAEDRHRAQLAALRVAARTRPGPSGPGQGSRQPGRPTKAPSRGGRER